MGFQHSFQQQHKMSGWASALKSAKTPTHLRAHLAKRVTPGKSANLNVQSHPATAGTMRSSMAPAKTFQAPMQQNPAALPRIGSGLKKNRRGPALNSPIYG